MDVKKVGRRRVATSAVPGSDPTPQTGPDGQPVRAAEDTDQAWGVAPRTNGGGASGASGEQPNDERLRRDVPPHW
ncbi:hypothetical protein NVV95_08845 [Herbiconiux sp. CPCC 205716]|uniref:Uncharacterized protein n=1 Tax=Herbiconiux gentiana TaxID=2970912 RepID=A0ABT2GEK4_9MICO|nr:hypothetical protein [Herbiconiux gentiana]MCS5714658.1 hypothetical protein [Herbiconiux gentiana]